MDKPRFAGLVREHATRAGLTDREIAERLSVDPSLLSRWQNPRDRAKPRKSDIARLCEIFSLDEQQCRDLYDCFDYRYEDSGIPQPTPPQPPSRRGIPVRFLVASLLRRTFTSTLAVILAATVVTVLGLAAWRFFSPDTAREVILNPADFSPQYGDELLFDVRYSPTPGLTTTIQEGGNLTNYDMDLTLQSGNGRRAQLWSKDCKWNSVYSKQYTIESNRPIRYNPFKDGRDVDERPDFTRVCAVGIKISGGTSGVRIVSARLLAR